MLKLLNIKNYRVLTAVLLMFLSLASCTKEREADASVVILKAETSSSHSVTFNITPLSVEQCAWMCVNADETAPSAEEILAKGVYVDVANSSKQTAFGLEPSTTYVIYVAAQRNGVAILSQKNLSLTTTEQQESPAETTVYELNNMLEALYSTDNAQGNGSYYISLSSCPVDEDGMPTSLNGVVVMLDMFGPADDDEMNATLPSGEYTLDSSKDLYFGKTYSFVFKKIGSTSDDIESASISSGKVTVARSGDEYTIDMDFVLSNDETFKAHFNGALMFVHTGNSSYYRFSEPQDVTFTSANGRYYGNWFYPHADDFSLQFYSGTLDENGNMVDGYVLTVPLYTEKLADTSVENLAVKAGIYSPINLVASLNFIPNTYVRGTMEEIWGSAMPTGTYLQRIDGSTGKKYIGFADSGTITVSEKDGEYEFSFDFVSEKGVTLHGEYAGGIKVRNFCNNSSMPERPWSTLTEDIDLKFPADAKFNAYFMGEYLYPGLNSWAVTLASDTVEGEMITTEFFTPKEDGMTIKPGRYVVAEKFEAYTMLPGFQPYGTANVAYTWFGDLSTKDEDGYAGKLAPIVSGTMDVTASGDVYTFVFDFVDDKGIKVSGSWSGKVEYIDYTESSIEATASSVRSSRPLTMKQD